MMKSKVGIIGEDENDLKLMQRSPKPYASESSRLHKYF